MRVKLDNNQSILRIINNTDETIHYTPQLSMGIVDKRSLGYYNVRKSIMFFNKRGNNMIGLLFTDDRLGFAVPSLCCMLLNVVSERLLIQPML